MGQRETVLDISGLHSSYGMIKAIKDINIHVDKGELVSLLGANGAGKSTLLKSVIGMVHIERGSIKYQGCLLYTSIKTADLKWFQGFKDHVQRSQVRTDHS